MDLLGSAAAAAKKRLGLADGRLSPGGASNGGVNNSHQNHNAAECPNDGGNFRAGIMRGFLVVVDAVIVVIVVSGVAR